jgi:hypothetical protein
VLQESLGLARHLGGDRFCEGFRMPAGRDVVSSASMVAQVIGRKPRR